MVTLYDRSGMAVSADQLEQVLTADFRVARDEVADRHSAELLEVSTVFLRGIAHGFDAAGAPFLFETMVFNTSGESMFYVRYVTESAAVDGHAHIVSIIRSDGLDSDLIHEGLYSE